MKSAGGLDPIYVAARHVLLDSLEAIKEHLSSLILVGAQAVYLRTGEADVAVPPYTTDGDLAIDPRQLNLEPLIEEAMQNAGFSLAKNAVGIWQRSVDVEGVARTINVDLLVPESLGGRGRRAARIPPHASGTARKVSGLEGALVDRDQFTIMALDPADQRRFELLVAGPAALLTAKIYKLLDRVDSTDRRSDKDALDVYRLLRATATDDLANRFRTLLTDPLSAAVAETAVGQLPQLFGGVNATGTRMAVSAAVPLENEETLAASMVALTEDLLEALT
jgi:hypothetical protein